MSLDYQIFYTTAYVIALPAFAQLGYNMVSLLIWFTGYGQSYQTVRPYLTVINETSPVPTQIEPTQIEPTQIVENEPKKKSNPVVLPYPDSLTLLAWATLNLNLQSFEDKPRFPIKKTWQHFKHENRHKHETRHTIERISQNLSKHGILLPMDCRNKGKPIDVDMAQKYLAGEIRFEFD